MTKRVQQLAVSTRNTKANGAPFRHIMFYGPPGTGKTMVAKRLARSAGLEYAVRVHTRRDNNDA
jgi:ATPase family AAA domain-containing protein 3A/B